VFAGLEIGDFVGDRVGGHETTLVVSPRRASSAWR
jgi:hypothetical protein